MSGINTLINEIFSLFSDMEMYKQHDKFPLEKRSKKIFATMGITELSYNNYYDYGPLSQTYPTQLKLKIAVFASPDSSEEVLYEFLEGRIIPRLYKNSYNVKNIKISGAEYNREYDRLSLVSEILMTGYSTKSKK